MGHYLRFLRLIATHKIKPEENFSKLHANLAIIMGMRWTDGLLGARTWKVSCLCKAFLDGARSEGGDLRR